MRILNVTQSYFPFEEFGGPPVKVRSLSQHLQKLGHEVTVLTVDWSSRSKGFSWTRRENGSRVEKSALGWRQVENGVEAIYLPTWARYRALSWNSGIGRFCRARLWNFDVAHIFGLYDLLGPRVAAACRRAELPYVVEPMGMLVPILRSFRLKRMYHRIFGQSMLGSARAMVATSPQEAAEMGRAGVPGEKIVVRRNGVDAPQVQPERGRFRSASGISRDAKLVLYLGRLSEKKSPDLLVRAFAQMVKSKDAKEARLVIAGPDERGMKTRLARLAETLGVSAQVQLPGGIFGEEKWSAYRDTDVFVLPSQNENFGNTAGEAALAGTPVILTEKCGIAPLLGAAALVVKHDVEALSDALGRVLFDGSVRAWLSAGCREAAARLDWEEPAREMESLYKRLANKQEKFAEALP